MSIAASLAVASDLGVAQSQIDFGPVTNVKGSIVHFIQARWAVR